MWPNLTAFSWEHVYFLFVKNYSLHFTGNHSFRVLYQTDKLNSFLQSRLSFLLLLVMTIPLIKCMFMVI